MMRRQFDTSKQVCPDFEPQLPIVSPERAKQINNAHDLIRLFLYRIYQRKSVADTMMTQLFSHQGCVDALQRIPEDFSLTDGEQDMIRRWENDVFAD